MGRHVPPVRIWRVWGDPARRRRAGVQEWYDHLLWHRRASWRRLTCWDRWWRMTVDSLAWPAAAAVAAAREVGRHGADAREATGTPIWRQWCQAWWTAVWAWQHPECYYQFGLYRPERRRSAHRFVSRDPANLVLTYCNDTDECWRLRDKATFEVMCRRAGVPCPPTLAYFEGGRLVRAGVPDGDLPRADLFVKLRDQSGGTGTERWLWDGQGYTDGARRLSPAELHEHLRQKSKRHACLVQPRLANHPFLEARSTGALCTIRVVTARRPGGEPFHVINALRLGRGANIVDSFERSALACPVELETGRLGAAISGRVGERFGTHPDTGAPIEGEVLPFWREVVDLCVKAHRPFGTVAAVGWDVAVTPQGPVLVEANMTWAVVGPQAIQGLPLESTELTAALHEHLRARRQSGAAEPVEVVEAACARLEARQARLARNLRETFG